MRNFTSLFLIITTFLISFFNLSATETKKSYDYIALNKYIDQLADSIKDLNKVRKVKRDAFEEHRETGGKLRCLINWNHTNLLLNQKQIYGNINNLLQDVNIKYDVPTFIIYARNFFTNEKENILYDSRNFCMDTVVRLAEYTSNLLYKKVSSDLPKCCLVIFFKYGIKKGVGLKTGYLIRIRNSAFIEANEHLTGLESQFYINLMNSTYGDGLAETARVINVIASQDLEVVSNKEELKLPESKKASLIKKTVATLNAELKSCNSGIIKRFIFDKAEIFEDELKDVFDDKLLVLERETKIKLYVITFHVSGTLEEKYINQLAKEIYAASDLGSIPKSALILVPVLRDTLNAFNICYNGLALHESIKNLNIKEDFPQIRKRTGIKPHNSLCFKSVIDAFVKIPKPFYRFEYYLDADGTILTSVYKEEETVNYPNIYELSIRYDSIFDDNLIGEFDEKKIKEYFSKSKRRYKDFPEMLQANKFLARRTLRESAIKDYSEAHAVNMMYDNYALRIVSRGFFYNLQTRPIVPDFCYFYKPDLSIVYSILDGCGYLLSIVNCDVFADAAGFIISKIVNDKEVSCSYAVSIVIGTISYVKIPRAKFKCSKIKNWVEAASKFGKKWDNFLDEIGEGWDETLKQKFRSEVGPNADFQKLITSSDNATKIRIANIWKKLDELKLEKAWVKNSAPLIERLKDKPDAFIEKIKEFYSNFSKKSDLGPPPFTQYKKNYPPVSYDVFGFPDFVPSIPEMVDYGKLKYVPDKLNLKSLSGNTNDMKLANNYFMNACNKGDNLKFKKLSNGQCMIKVDLNTYPYKELADEDGWVLCVWHHCEDGKTMIPVPTKLHNRDSLFGSPHNGGASIIDNDLIGFFDPPKF